MVYFVEKSRKSFSQKQRRQRKRCLKKNKEKINAKINAKIDGREFPLDAGNLTEEESDNDERNISECLQDWAIQHNIKTRALRNILQILISFGFFGLPKDPRTLLKTPKNHKIENKANGQTWYSGIESNLRKLFPKLDNDTKADLNFHLDGVQIYKSAIKSFWPLLAHVNGLSIEICQKN